MYLTVNHFPHAPSSSLRFLWFFLWGQLCNTFIFCSSTTCTGLNNLCVRTCAFVIYVLMQALAEYFRFCVCLCARARGGGGRLKVRYNQLFKLQGSTSTTTTPLPSFCPTQASSQDSAKLRDRWAWHRHTNPNTGTHLLELQLNTTSQSNTPLLSKQHQNTPTTFQLKAEGFQVITHPPAAMCKVLSSCETASTKR